MLLSRDIKNVLITFYIIVQCKTAFTHQNVEHLSCGSKLYTQLL